jgi:pilus assembly protein Flp/PilA
LAVRLRFIGAIPLGGYFAHVVGNFTHGAFQMIKSIKTFVANESGATAIEYALIASLIAVAIIASISVLGSKLQNTFNEVSGNLK